MIEGFAIFLVFQLIGEAIARGIGLPVPGPVIGLVLLFVFFWRLPTRLPLVGGAADALHKHFSLLFVPAGVGVMLHLPLLAREWLAIVVAVVVSTLIGLATTALVVNALIERQSDDQ